ncbi:pleckstrin homology domain-containing family A member 7 isoform X7 [Gadus macrocephalus]|uniref:pleckstrin homology domain-containing family A member 7 isoform X7 n=1 Tax=Gadus macrocephalus TaxID=80720 RepID=UPI0028CB5F45|nr:pleckstrin homology domain-containing family A member 7 isoform X7 [Gadus macrocephalus]
MAAPLARDTLPDQWSYGVCRDGRVFFINDKTRSTTWLHPRTAEPVNSGHMIRSDLPRGWEEGFTDEGASYFINHNQRSTSFRHPVTGQISPENTEYTLQDRIESRMSKQLANQRTPSVVSQSSTGVPSTAVDTTPGSRNLRASGKVHSFGKRDHAIKRNLNVPVVVRGWLYKQDSSGMRLWKRKWFVLSDFCLFYYKDSREETVLGSIPLPSYVITPVDPDDHISRKYAFKASHTGMRSYIYNKNSVIGSQAEHCGMRTYFFSADTQEDLNGWIRAMNQAARMQQSHTVKRELERPEKAVVVQQQAVPQSHHSGGGKQTPGQRDAPHRAQREEPQDNGVRLAPGEEVRYGLEIHGRPPQPATGEEGRVDGRSPDPGPGPGPRNGHLTVAHVSLPSEANGNAGYKRAPGPRMSTEKEVQRKTALAQVEHWVKVQKGDPPMSAPSAEYHLPRRTPPTKPKANGGAADPSLPSLPSPSYLSLPKGAAHLPPSASSPPAASKLTSDYKYAHDRLSHFCMSTDERTATKEGMVWQLYEWQQRQQFRHGSPTAPIYTPGPGFLDASAFRVTVEMPRSISVPPSPSDLQPPPPRVPASFKPLSPRRPHTPLGRVTVKPLDDGAVAPPPGDSTMSHSPRSVCAPLSQMERRSMPAMGYITHTVSAPSLHGKTPEELTLLLIQLRRHQAKMAGVLSPADDFAPLPPLQQNGLLGPSLQADDTYIQLKKDLDYLDLKIQNIDPMIVSVHSVLENSTPGFGYSWNVTGRESLKERALKPVKIAESDADVKLSRLCEQDKILQELEVTIRALKEDKDKLESVLDISHQQMEQYQDQPAHAEKIAYQQRLLQEDVVHIRADISQVSTEMENAWGEYSRLEGDVDWLRSALQAQMNRNDISQQEKAELRKELWRMEDVMAGLSSSKANYKVTLSSVTNPERKFVPSVSASAVPSGCGSPSAVEMRQQQQQQHSPHLSPTSPSPRPGQQPLLHPTAPISTRLIWGEEDAPPRPPLPQLYSPDEHPPAVPPLPRETNVIRHTSVRGLKRQSDERKRDRETGQFTNGDGRLEIRCFLSEPELLGIGGNSSHIGTTTLARDGGYQTLPSRGMSGSSSMVNQSSNISSYVTIRRAASAVGWAERPKSALERLYSGEPALQQHQQQLRGKMSADEQLERMKRHQKALVRQRKRTLSHGDARAHGSASRAAASSSASTQRPLSADLGSWRREQEFDLQLLERAVQGEEARGEEARGEEACGEEEWEPERRSVQGEEGRPEEHQERPRSRSDEWLTFRAPEPLATAGTPPHRLEPLEYDLDLSKELSTPQKVLIPERYVDSEPEETLSPQEVEERHRKVERIKSILAKSSVQNLALAVAMDKKPEVGGLGGLDSALQEQERIITMSYALASEASLKSKQVTVPQPANHPPPPPPPPLPPLAPPAPPVSQAPPPPLSNGIHYTFV